jgi:hypothetical protein
MRPRLRCGSSPRHHIHAILSIHLCHVVCAGGGTGHDMLTLLISWSLHGPKLMTVTGLRALVVLGQLTHQMYVPLGGLGSSAGSPVACPP